MTRRRRFSYREVAGIAYRQTEAMTTPYLICPECQMPIGKEQMLTMELDHIRARGLSERGHERDQDNPANMAFVHKHCHKAKTARDRSRMAKADRQSGRKGQKARRNRSGGSRIKSRSFDKTLKKKFDGTVER